MRQISLFLVALAAVSTLTSCQKAEVKTEAEPHRAALRLPITVVKVQTLSEQLQLPGIVFALPDRSVKVSPGIAGKLIDVKVSPGQEVVRGQAIAVLDSRLLTNQVNQANAKVLMAQAGVAQANTNLLLAQNTEERNLRLVQQDVGAQKDLVAAKSQVDTAKAQVLAAQAQVDDAKAAVAALKAQLSYTEVKSPITGVVAQRFLNISDSADTTTPIVQIVDLSKVVVEAALPTTQPAKLTAGDTATITAKFLPGKQITGTVQSVDPVTDNQGTTIGVRISCPNPNKALKEGMPVMVTIVTGSHKDAMIVPTTALVSDPNNPASKMIYAFSDGKIKRVEVTTGIEKDGRTEILTGLKPGESIVASGAYGVPDDTEVQAENESLRAPSQVSSKSD